MRRAVFYKTWQEASAVCFENHIVDQLDYNKRYRLISNMLYSYPPAFYSDFPGWPEFLQRARKRKSYSGFFPTWQEASKVCIANKVKNMDDYYKRRKQIDTRLPEMPRTHYRSTWPGDRIFFGL